MALALAYLCTVFGDKCLRSLRVLLLVYIAYYRVFQWDTAAAQPYVKGVSYICLCPLPVNGCFSDCASVLFPFLGVSVGHCSCSTLREWSVVHLSVYAVHYRVFQGDTAAAQPYVSVEHFVCVRCPLQGVSVGQFQWAMKQTIP